MSDGSLFVKVWKVKSGGTIVAVCDSDIMGKKICEGKLVLDVSSDFYGGQQVSCEAATDMLRKATIANLVGEHAVRCGIEAGVVHKDAVIRIGGVPHAQFVEI